MTLGQLIGFLGATDPDLVFANGFSRGDSYRGFYDELAFEPAIDQRVADMLSHARAALDQTFTGYKGGDFVMSEYVGVWIAKYGETGEAVTPQWLNAEAALARGKALAE